jgi:hypothetical protein
MPTTRTGTSTPNTGFLNSIGAAVSNVVDNVNNFIASPGVQNTIDKVGDIADVAGDLALVGSLVTKDPTKLKKLSDVLAVTDGIRYVADKQSPTQIRVDNLSRNEMREKLIEKLNASRELANEIVQDELGDSDRRTNQRSSRSRSERVARRKKSKNNR